MTTVCTICARGGSKGVPRKNVRDLMGKPLIVHSIEQAQSCPQIDAVYVSTDDDEIAQVARDAGAIVPFKRPESLATSEAGKLPVIIHLVEEIIASGVEVTKIIDLDPTSPLRTIEDITAAFELLDNETDAVITGYVADKNPYFNMVEPQSDGNIRLVKKIEGNIVSRQVAPDVYSMNASIYVWHEHTLALGLWEGRTRLHVMPHERSVDIDNEIDFKLVELLMREEHERNIKNGQ
ncbi:acylneuraminate cytidylyltransferase family protein [Loktanella sp. F6476L]|uniref:acylneuraminate cytidylyltransferase family protein n=1 Tax=Loktanella sp. F6476L TaxID=2926405 RepID=UPI001FF3CB31|nr:acylneuraminate cytidylyltransferase family protein [Loktanella sp. F6476L]MCK0122126.1 acylneuraminate cytidylyltransferase family protein [Loktanella sp. F6476L]